jgi:hypothetical protein
VVCARVWYERARACVLVRVMCVRVWYACVRACMRAYDVHAWCACV